MFITLAETLSFTRCAEREHMSLSAVSRLLQRIEESVGQKLFERDRRNVRLTRAGEHFLMYARNSLGEWQNLLGELQPDAGQLSGEVSVYCSVTASYSVLSPILERLRAEHPAIDIMLHTGDQADAVDHVRLGREDIAVAARPDDLQDNVHFLTLQRSPLCLIAPAFSCAVGEEVDRLLATEDLKLLSQLPFIMAERGLSKERVDRWFAQHQLRPRSYAQVAGHEAIAAMVGLGLGVGVVPQLVVENSTYRDKLRTVESVLELEPFAIGLSALKQRLDSPLVQAFLDTAQRSYPDGF